MDIKISEKRLQELELAEKTLIALESNGVSNWEGYEISVNEINREAFIIKQKWQLLQDIEIALLNGVYEPSEQGAGFCAKDESRHEAFYIIDEFLQKYPNM